MSSRQYKIQKIDIANFRGITEGRAIEVGEKHLFLLGPNGYGKSTVVEAIRWCLFGSLPGQQEIEVRNTFYPAKASEVLINLVAGDKILKVRRNLSPGSQRSRQTITDGDGKEVLLREAFPQIARLGSPTGTQVIFAAQHAAGRQQTEIQDFSKVLYFYLGIEEIPEFLEKLRKIMEERQAEREALADSLDKFAHELREEQALIQGKKEEITENPPWGKGSIPTRAETDRKIETLFNEMARMVEDMPAEGLSCPQKLQKIEEWSDELSSKEQAKLKTNLEELQEKSAEALKCKNDWQETRESIDRLKTKIGEIEDRERSLLGGQTINALKIHLEEAEKEYNEASLRSDLLRLFSVYREKYHPACCPICNATLTTEAYNNASMVADDGYSAFEKLRERVTEITEVQKELNSSQENLLSLERRNEELAKDAEKITGKEDNDLDDVDQLIKELGETIRALHGQLEDTQSEQDRRNRRVNELKAEERFHYYQDQVAAIERVLSKDIEGPRNSLAEYDSFLATLEEVGKLLLDTFNKQIDSTIPTLADRLTGVYAKLTGHPSYDGVAITKQSSELKKMEPGHLELQVTSSRCPDRSFPVNVLNGQAARALQLVPYFVFSDYWHELMELDLLLIDDPSESFDTSHLDNLMNVLHSVSSHTQLVVASHESDRMQPLIEKNFAENERCILEVADFDPFKGPNFEKR